MNQKNKIQESLVTMLSFSLKQKSKLDREINEELGSKEIDLKEFQQMMLQQQRNSMMRQFLAQAQNQSDHFRVLMNQQQNQQQKQDLKNE